MKSYAQIATRSVEANGITINVAVGGEGPAVLLLHGWPHTWQIWHKVMPLLTSSFKVIAPDLRGIGGTTRAPGGYDLNTLADDAVGLLNALDVDDADVVGIDLGVQIATMVAIRHRARTRRMILMEGLVGTLPGAEGFLSKGPPWWFGFHAVPGLAETVLDGHAAQYIDWFLTGGTADRKGIDAPTRDAFFSAYSDREGLRGGFEHYRAFSTDAEQLVEALAHDKISVPTLAISGGVVGAATANQLGPVTIDLSTATIDHCGHLIPLEQPDALASAIRRFIV